ncbi:MAG: metal ABC transporter substrate-binding protein [Treponema sp.]|nr:metal ABC transporter substrate-binding protein [Treponema sp.]
MKRILLIVITFTVVFFVLAGCRQNRNTVRQEGKINVTATIFPAYDFVRQIAGDRVNLSMLLSPGAESHSFEPSPRDIITIQNSDVFVFVGGDSDMWIERILQSMDTEHMSIFAMIDFVDLVEGVACNHDHDDLDHDDPDHDDHEHICDDIEYDEHVWTSPRNAIQLVREIAILLCEIDPVNAAFFQQNAAAYIAELEQLDAAFAAVVAGAVRNTIIFGDRFPFRYFADAYGLEWFAAFPGCSTETEPSAATVAFLIDKIRAEGIPVVFHIELSNERMANTISGETGAKKRLLHSIHNITRRDFDAGLGYLELMRRNAENLREALH